MKLLVPLLLPVLAVIGCSSSVSTKKDNLAESIQLEVEELKLDNGMTALIVPNHKLPIFSLYMFYKVGGKNEVKGITGASHFLEHMMFKGAKRYGQNKIDFLIEGSGGSTNAYTTSDQTVYYENLPSTELATILDIESDRMENLLLDPDAFEKERQVVLEERKMRYENSPRGQLYLELMQTLFKDTPYGTSVIGDIADLKSVSRDQIYAYFKRFYAPNNVTLVLVGDVDPKKAKEIIRQRFAEIPASPTINEARASLTDKMFEPKITSDMVVSRKGESPAPIFMLAYPTVKVGHEKGYALDMLSSIIGSGKSSALINQYILIPKPMATSMYAAHQQLEMSGFFFIGGELVRGVKIENFRKDLQQKLRSFCATEITDRNLQKIKNNYLIGIYGGLDTNAGLAQFLGDRQLVFGDWRKYREELANYEKVTTDDVKKACHEVVSSKSVFVSVWDQHK